MEKQWIHVAAVKSVRATGTTILEITKVVRSEGRDHERDSIPVE